MISKSSAAIVLSLGMLLSSMSGCTTAGRNARDPGADTVPNAPTPNTQMGNEQSRAANIKNQLKKMPELRDVNVLVNNNTALVGFTPADPKKDTDALRRTVMGKVMEIDNTVTNVRASSSPDMLERMKQLANMSGDQMGNRFEQLMRDMTPGS